MFCVYCGKKFTGVVFICDNCGNINKLEPFAPHIKVRPKAFLICGVTEEKILAESKYEKHKRVIVTNKRIILNNFFSGRQFYINDTKYAEYTPPDRSDFYRGGIIGYAAKKLFNSDISFFGAAQIKLFELKQIENAEAVLKAFNTAKFGIISPEEFMRLPEYIGSGVMANIFSAVEKFFGKSEISRPKPLFDENAYLNGMLTEASRMNSSGGMFQKGLEAFQNGDFEKAEFFFKKHCDENGGAEEGYIFHAAALDNLSRFDEAINACDAALKINRGSCRTLKMQAYSLYRAARYHESCDNFEKAAKNFSGRLLADESGPADFLFECAFGAGCCYHKTGSLDIALDRFETALKVNDNNAAAWMKKGLCHQELAEYKKAVDCYAAASKIMHYKAAALFFSAAALYELGKENYKAAFELFKYCSQNSPPDSDLKREAELSIEKGSDSSMISRIKNFFTR